MHRFSCTHGSGPSAARSRCSASGRFPLSWGGWCGRRSSTCSCRRHWSRVALGRSGAPGSARRTRSPRPARCSSGWRPARRHLRHPARAPRLPGRSRLGDAGPGCRGRLGRAPHRQRERARRPLRHGGGCLPDPRAQRVRRADVGAWILAIGLMRYAFVAAGWVPPPRSHAAVPLLAEGRRRGVRIALALVAAQVLPGRERAVAASALVLVGVVRPRRDLAHPDEPFGPALVSFDGRKSRRKQVAP